MLSATQSDGSMMREHYESLKKRYGVVPDEVKNLIPAMPRRFIQEWRWFLELNDTRQNGMSIERITHVEMKAFFDLKGIDPEPLEVEIIKMFDAIAVRTMQEHQEKERQLQKARADADAAARKGR